MLAPATQVQELPGLRVTKVAVGAYDNNVYLLRCAETGETVLVDAAFEPDRILQLLADDPLRTIVQTHCHWDHVQALGALRAATGARLACHRGEVDTLPDDDQPDLLVEDGDEVAVGLARLRAIHLAGHTPGGLALLYDAAGALTDSPHLFTGDSLFPGGPGRTTTPEDFISLMDDLEAKVFGPLPDATTVYPGHGRDTTLGAERAQLPQWRARGW